MTANERARFTVIATRPCGDFARYREISRGHAVRDEVRRLSDREHRAPRLAYDLVCG
jgi:hypothetical protein